MSHVVAALEELLGLAAQAGASDLHLLRGAPPSLRVDGAVRRLPGEPLSLERIRAMVDPLLTERLTARLERNLDVDLSFERPGLGRFRVSVFYQRGGISAAIRIIPWALRSRQELGLPPLLEELVARPDGLLLVAGAVGQGKTTTLNTLIDLVNATRPARIITIEDPIEFLHEHKVGMVLQREVGTDARSFSRALVAALRQDPNVICIGEMRDRRTVATALNAAETGHLVLSTLHTQDAAHTMERIVDIFPPHQAAQARAQLAGTLLGVLCQRLLPRAGGGGRILAYELLVATPAVRRLLREGRTDQIPNVLTTSREQGMVSMDQSVQHLLRAGEISLETACRVMLEPDQLQVAGR